MSSNLAHSMTKMVEILLPLTSEERMRVVNASLTLLGEAGVSVAAVGALPTPLGSNPANLGDRSGISPQALPWLTKNNLSKEELEQWFHFDQGTVTPLELAGGASNRSQQTINTYLIQGLAAFLATGEASFGDREARDLCERFGCYDKTNHAKFFAKFGNKITGSKSSGWKLTTPGLSAAGTLIKSGGSA